MAIELNHTIVPCRDRMASSRFLTELFGLPPATVFGVFLVVEVDNGVSLDYMEVSHEIRSQHYAFLVGENEFTEISGRIIRRAIPYWADPGRSVPDAINHHDDGRGMYFADPDDHLFEIITRPYGSG